MRVVKTDRGYIDMDHVLAVGEPYKFTQGMFGFDVILAFRDKPRAYLYYPEDLGVTHELRLPAAVRDMAKEAHDENSFEGKVMEALSKKRDEFVRAWAGDTSIAVLGASEELVSEEPNPPMDTARAAFLTLQYCGWENDMGKRSPQGEGVSHAIWVLQQVYASQMSAGKANRWLGWAQCLMVMYGHLTLDQAKDFNRQASGENVGATSS